MILAVLNNKGGVGKTTVAVNLAAALAAARRRVLLVDLDSQASASAWLGVRPGRLKPSSASVLLHDFPIEQAIRPTLTPGLFLLTASIELANADVALADVRGRETTLKHALSRVARSYDVVVLDCPPGMSLLAVNAVVAADGIIVPVPPQPLAIQSLRPLLASVATVRRRLDASARLLGVVISMADDASADTRELARRIRAEHRDAVFRTAIDVSRALRDAPAAAKTIFAFAPRSRAATGFRALADEVMERLGAGGD